MLSDMMSRLPSDLPRKVTLRRVIDTIERTRGPVVQQSCADVLLCILSG